MSELKFRAWHPKEKVMGEMQTLTNEGGFVVGVKAAPDTPVGDKYGKIILRSPKNGRFCKFNEIRVMQSLGSTDQAGTELFEGDIVQHAERKEFSGLIRYSKGGYFAVGKTKTDDRQEVWQGLFMERRCIKIGNCYENPELMGWYQQKTKDPEQVKVQGEVIEGEIVNQKKALKYGKNKGGKK